MKKRRKILSLLLCMALAISMMPVTKAAVYAAGLENGKSALTVNQSKVAFAGREWWVVGDGTTGVYPQKGHVTLLAANLQTSDDQVEGDEFLGISFRNGKGTAFSNYRYYRDKASGTMGGYYEPNPPSMKDWEEPSEYAGSTLQQKMETIADDIPIKEQAVISRRTLSTQDGIKGQSISDQRLWALSFSEVNTVANTDILKHPYHWWLRSPSTGHAGTGKYDDIIAYFVINTTGTTNAWDVLSSGYSGVVARPALSLNLSSVFFTSAADETSGKSSAALGGSLVEAEPLTGTVKFTMKDSNQKLTVNATTAQSTQVGETLVFSYSNATTGENQYISCILTDESGAVEYYGKLADSSNAESGNLSIPLSGVADGIYTMKIFSEEANGALYTDFCSEPVTMKVAVTDGSGTVSEFGGTLLHEHDWNENIWNYNDTHHWHECIVLYQNVQLRITDRKMVMQSTHGRTVYVPYVR